LGGHGDERSPERHDLRVALRRVVNQTQGLLVGWSTHNCRIERCPIRRRSFLLWCHGTIACSLAQQDERSQRPIRDFEGLGIIGVAQRLDRVLVVIDPPIERCCNAWSHQFGLIPNERLAEQIEGFE
jgi:hypothetical protein